jgi:drug/metabolite transporter (DMT)-like permease
LANTYCRLAWVPAFPFSLFAFSTTKISSSVNGIINSLSPLFTVITGAVFFQLSIQKQKVYGVLIGLGRRDGIGDWSIRV